MRKILLLAGLAGVVGCTCLGYAWSQQTNNVQTGSRPRVTASQSTLAVLGYVEPEFVGTMIQTHPNASGYVRALQSGIATELSQIDSKRFVIAKTADRLDPPYAQRLHHFAWCGQRDDLRFIGWRGVIREASKTAHGWTAKVAITPRLAHGGAVATTPDYVVETYAKVDGQIQLVDFLVPPDARSGFVLSY